MGLQYYSKQLVKAKQNLAPLIHKHDHFLQYPHHNHQFIFQHNYDIYQRVYSIILDQIPNIFHDRSIWIF